METTYKAVQKAGGRLTKVKKAIIDILLKSDCFLSRLDLLVSLKRQRINPDRSTIYRELQFLTKNGLVVKNTIGGIDYYEIPQNHHHHLVCINCQAISRIEFGNHLKKQEKQIARKNNFNIINHSLEFYGYCHKCQR